MKKTNKISARKAILAITILVVTILLTSMVFAICPPTCSEQEFNSLILSDPLAAYKHNPDKAILIAFGSILDNPAVADAHFKKKPDDVKDPMYKAYVQKYLASQKNLNPILFRKYLTSTVYTTKDLDLARKYLNKVSFSNAEDRSVFVKYGASLKSYTSTDKVIAKKFFTTNNGKYINDGTETRGLFSKYLGAEGISVSGINGPITSFSKNGILKCKNGDVNVYDLAGDGAKNKYLLKVETNGNLALIMKVKSEIRTKYEQDKVRTLGRGWNGLMGKFGIETLQLSDETIESAAGQREVYVEPVGNAGNVPFSGSLKVDGETGKVSMTKGSIRHIDVKGATEVEFTPRSFSGKFKEVAGVVFKEPFQVNVIDFASSNYATTYPTGEKPRITPILEGYGATIERINNYEFGSFTRTVKKNGVEVEETILPDLYHKSNAIQLAGEFDIDDYSKISDDREISVASTNIGNGLSLTLNSVNIAPHKGGYTTYVFFPQHKIKDSELSERFVQFQKDGIVSVGHNTEVILSPVALVKNELAATGKTTSLVDLPSRGYFKVGDKPAKNSRTHTDLLSIQELVGAKQTGVYDKQTSDKVKKWQETQKLDRKPISPDGYFGEESLQAYLQSTEGDIKIVSKDESHHAKISSKDGRLQLKGYGFVDAEIGRKKYAFELPGQSLDSDLVRTQIEASADDSFSSTVRDVTPEILPNQKLLQLAGLTPGVPDVTFSSDIVSGTTIFPEENKKYLAAHYAYIDYFKFDRNAQFQQSGNLVDTLVNPALFLTEETTQSDLLTETVSDIEGKSEMTLSAGKRIVPGVNPQFKHLVDDDGKLVMLYIAGEGDEDGKRLDHDTNLLFAPGTEPDKAPPTQIHTQTYETPDGKQIEVEVRVVFDPKLVEQEYLKKDVDVVHIRAHSVSWRTQEINLGKERGKVSPETIADDVRRDPSLKIPDKQRLISIRSCVSTQRVYPGFKKLEETLRPGATTDYLVAEHKPVRDIGTDVLSGLLTGKSLDEIKTIANAEHSKPMFVTNPKG